MDVSPPFTSAVALVFFIILAADRADKVAVPCLPLAFTPCGVIYLQTDSLQLKMNKIRNLSKNVKNHLYTTLEVYGSVIDLHQ
ncbi:hypothetical protein FG170_24170 [Serratia marcescens]|jgi:hypothetical protein|nr:hypothetical protein BVG95_19260 [Serratia marcescens]PIJ09791.1 hypothetical protein BVV00_09780 [Serratia sp. OMLW3]PIJ19623.1 hypothetical protein BVU99_04860 [Serratia sp. OLAL2]TXE47074.1 hypothetical protein FOT55_16400 [Serratia bockelmannii]ASM34216.1 hypothetical protein BVG84_20110 [Serratia marcescens]